MCLACNNRCCGNDLPDGCGCTGCNVRCEFEPERYPGLMDDDIDDAELPGGEA